MPRGQHDLQSAQPMTTYCMHAIERQYKADRPPVNKADRYVDLDAVHQYPRPKQLIRFDPP